MFHYIDLRRRILNIECDNRMWNDLFRRYGSLVSGLGKVWIIPQYPLYQNRHRSLCFPRPDTIVWSFHNKLWSRYHKEHDQGAKTNQKMGKNFNHSINGDWNAWITEDGFLQEKSHGLYKRWCQIFLMSKYNTLTVANPNKSGSI